MVAVSSSGCVADPGCVDPPSAVESNGARTAFNGRQSPPIAYLTSASLLICGHSPLNYYNKLWRLLRLLSERALTTPTSLPVPRLRLRRRGRRLHREPVVPRLRLQYQDFANRYDLCLSHLEDAAREAEALRIENAQLRMANGELKKRFSARTSSAAAASSSPISIADEFRRLRIENSPAVVESPTSVLEPRVSLPKSISVRSTGYKKLGSEGGSNRSSRTRVSKPVMVGSVSLPVHFCSAL
ncbi:uncharacterized protein A4U43_C01F7930 [Asparagus officinalis]|uniref:Uncharacterized protein n=1 Tax=Asparagus officinalis TaxID=4686 RepID=A0A5P1FSA7_ASPOF|nr:uncharacterized protein A4U43_C01F7930 [Asparagus officinalis]